jgi:hypothetical protein
VLDCRIIDVSLSGASIAIAEKPPLETEVILGRMRGRIARHHDTGLAVQFAELQDPDSIARSFGQVSRRSHPTRFGVITKIWRHHKDLASSLWRLPVIE